MPRKTHGKKTRHPGVYRLPSGKWLIRVFATDTRTGQRREVRRTLAAEALEAEVLATLHQLKVDLSRGEVAAPAAAPQRPSLTECAERWLEAKARRLRVSTANLYADALARRILPHLGDLYVDAVNRADIERWVTWAEQATMDDGAVYSRDTVNGWWRVLCQFLRDVCAEHGVPDPIVRVRPPRSRTAHRRERRTLSGDELTALLDNIAADWPDRYAEVYVMAYTGMRPGELFALQWDDIDEDRGRIHIRRAHRHGVVDATKTGDPREVALTPRMIELLRSQRRALIASQHRGLEQGLVFPSRVGTLRGPESLHKPLAAASQAIGLDLRVGPQVLRRTFNTLMLQAGVDRIVLRSQMGHCSEEMTERYAGVSVEAKLAAVRRLENLTR
ncbi:MAG: site-specific integrase [Myxococcales bacterium]|nr:site-specific integrase [Myxococcales bacterium]